VKGKLFERKERKVKVRKIRLRNGGRALREKEL
jgi:hypothetical protein